jgi:ferredoxin
MTEKLHIDWTACDARGQCTELLPELLDQDEWGYPLPRGGAREPVVPAQLAAHARRAVTHCPRLALRLLAAPAENGGAAGGQPRSGWGR